MRCPTKDRLLPRREIAGVFLSFAHFCYIIIRLNSRYAVKAGFSCMKDHMRHICSNTFRKSITLIMMFFLTAVCCVSFDVSYDSFSSGGSIKGISQAKVSHSLTVFAHTGVREDRSTDGSSGQSLQNAAATTHILSRLIRKLLQFVGISRRAGTPVSYNLYLISLCISGCAFLLCLALVRLIHLKDGSK